MSHLTYINPWEFQVISIELNIEISDTHIGSIDWFRRINLSVDCDSAVGTLLYA